jgi:hypothetical protein
MSNPAAVQEGELGSGFRKIQASLQGVFARFLEQTKQIDRSMAEGRYAEARGQIRSLEASLEWAVEELNKSLTQRT